MRFRSFSALSIARPLSLSVIVVPVPLGRTARVQGEFGHRIKMLVDICRIRWLHRKFEGGFPLFAQKSQVTNYPQQTGKAQTMPDGFTSIDALIGFLRSGAQTPSLSQGEACKAKVTVLSPAGLSGEPDPAKFRQPRRRRSPMSPCRNSHLSETM